MIFSLALVFLVVASVRMAAGVLAFVHKLLFPLLINRSIDQQHRLLFASLLALYKMEKRAEGGLTQEEITLLLSGILTIAFTPFTPNNKKRKIQKESLISMAPQIQWHHVKVLLKRFHLNGNTIGFHPQTQKLELCTKNSSMRALFNSF